MTTQTKTPQMISRVTVCYLRVVTLFISDICFRRLWTAVPGEQSFPTKPRCLCSLIGLAESYFILLGFQVSLENIMEAMCQVSERWTTLGRVELCMSLCLVSHNRAAVHRLKDSWDSANKCMRSQKSWDGSLVSLWKMSRHLHAPHRDPFFLY